MKQDPQPGAAAGHPAAAPLPLPAALADRIGVTHADGSYNFTDADYMSEGARKILELGSRVIKIWFTPRLMAHLYPYNSRWPVTDDLVTLAESPHVRSLFSLPFTTYILEVVASAGHDWLKGVSGTQASEIQEEHRRFAGYLLRTYRGTGKTFVLQNWEGDNAIGQDAPDATVQGMIAWTNARQAGISQARAEEGTDGVQVAGAVEVNKISTAWSGARMVDAVLPSTRCDLYSYSDWETWADGDLLRRNLDHLAARAPASSLYGSRNIFLGEFGAGEMVWKGAETQLRHSRAILDTALAWGARYAVYWELYCNERRVDGRRVMHRDFDHRLTPDDLAGFWLLRPDGSPSLVWSYLKDILAAR